MVLVSSQIRDDVGEKKISRMTFFWSLMCFNSDFLTDFFHFRPTFDKRIPPFLVKSLKIRFD